MRILSTAKLEEIINRNTIRNDSNAMTFTPMGLLNFPSTPSTIVDAKRLKALLKRIRTQGYNVSHGDLDPGAFSVAAPVRDHAGRVVASISVAGPQSRLTRDLETLYIRMVIAAAGEVSAKLGWHAPVETPELV